MEKDIIFIDTNIFVSENYFLEGNSINQLMTLAEDGFINILWPEIAYEEVKSHLLRDVLGNFREVCGKDNKALRNNDVFLSFCQTGAKSVERCVLKKLERFKSRSNAYIIPYSYCIDVEGVFKKYFNKEKPFGSDKKKYEFPDAFIIQALEKYCQGTGLNKIIVLTQDKDFVSSSSHLKVVRDYKQYVSDKLADKVVMDELHESLDKNSILLIKEWQKEIEELLNDDRTYLVFCNYDDISDITIKQCRIKLDKDDLYVLGVDEDMIRVEVHPIVTFSVEVEYHDTSEASYDKEFDEWYGDEWKTETINLTVEFKSILNYNKENRDFEIESSDYDEIEREISRSRKY